MRWDRIDGERLVQGRSGHQGHNEEQRGEALTQLHAASRMPAEQGRLGVVCDGAAWSWQHVQALLPQAWQVLDYDHCAQGEPCAQWERCSPA